MGAVKSIVMASSTPAMEMSQMKTPVASSSAVPADHVQPDAHSQENSDAPSTPSVLSNTAGPPSTNLKETLKERHVNMIGFSTMIGIGLFLSSGKAIFMAGPGAAVIAYILTGTIMSSAMACLAEMTALFPVRGVIFDFSRRFIDQSVGFAIGWQSWFAWIIICTSEILAITQLFKFKFEPEYLQNLVPPYPQERVEWGGGLEKASPAIWVSVFLIITLLVNLLPVRQYGRVEYVFGCIKMVFLVGLILFNTIINAREKFHDARFWTYEFPYSFSRNTFIARVDSNGESTITLTGALGGLTSFWSTMTVTTFSMIGMDVILYTAPENRHLRRDETIKLAARKLSIRVILLYVLAVFTVGLNVPYDDKNLRDFSSLGVQGGQNSAFIIAAIREHVTGLPHLFNGFFIFSACSCGINCLYASSRALHALASIPEAWPDTQFFRRTVRGRLERTRLGVPMNAVFVSWLVALLAFLSVRTSQSQILGRMATVAVVSNLLVYGINCIAYLNFYRQINAAARGDLDVDLNLREEADRTHYDRSAPRYPYRTHLQWIRAVYALVGCTVLLIFQGWRSLLSPVHVDDFIAAYIPIILFLVLTSAYYIRDHGFRWRYWKRFAIGLVGLEFVGPILISEDSLRIPCEFCGAKHRRGHLRFPDRRAMLTRRNFLAFVEWLWVWMK